MATPAAGGYLRQAPSNLFNFWDKLQNLLEPFDYFWDMFVPSRHPSNTRLALAGAGSNARPARGAQCKT